MVAAQNLPDRARSLLAQRTQRAQEQTHGCDDAGWYVTHLGCPCLTVQGTCSVYVARPWACRTRYVSDAAVCHDLDAVRNPEALLEVDAQAAEVQVGTRQGLHAAYTAAGYPGGDMRLVAALNLCLRDMSVLRRWAEGEDTFAPARTG